jgi:hypothetical protein
MSFILCKTQPLFWKIMDDHILMIMKHGIIKIWIYGSIHNWGTEKECLIEKGLPKTTLDFFNLTLL